jgi:transcriptional repressor NrdR
MNFQMKCPFCGFDDTKVTDSRPTEGKKRRRRECAGCGKRFTTYESVEIPMLFVLKKDNTIEMFNRDKLIIGLSSAMKKRPVSVECLRKIADDIENHYANQMQTQVTTAEIGDRVLAALKEIDQVAYVRFASIYKDFGDVDGFVNIISELKNGSRRRRVTCACRPKIFTTEGRYSTPTSSWSSPRKLSRWANRTRYRFTRV